MKSKQTSRTSARSRSASAQPKQGEKLARKVRPLSEVLRYKNQRVINEFLSKFAVSDEEGREIFRELLKFLWLGSQVPVMPIFDTMLILDEMWHTFILHTKDYADFSDRYLGGMAHHEPDAKGRFVKPASPRVLAKRDALIDRTLALVCDRLGEETAELWYGTYAERYSLERIDSLRVSHKVLHGSAA